MSDSDPDSHKIAAATATENTHDDEEQKCPNEQKVGKNVRHRYWSSWEELTIVDIWRRHSAEVVTLRTNLPAFRKISEGMRWKAFQISPKDCRRKMTTLKNRYVSERQRLQDVPNYKKSEWKLYPLMDCLLAPKQKNPDLMHEQKIVNELLDEIPDLPPKYIPKMEIEQKYTPPTPAFQPSSLKRPYNGSSFNSHFIIKNRVTVERLEQLRVDNRRLAEERDNAQKLLEAEEKEFKVLESFLTDWQRKHEKMLLRIQCVASN